MASLMAVVLGDGEMGGEDRTKGKWKKMNKCFEG